MSLYTAVGLMVFPSDLRRILPFAQFNSLDLKTLIRRNTLSFRTEAVVRPIQPMPEFHFTWPMPILLNRQPHPTFVRGAVQQVSVQDQRHVWLVLHRGADPEILNMDAPLTQALGIGGGHSQDGHAQFHPNPFQ